MGLSGPMKQVFNRKLELMGNPFYRIVITGEERSHASACDSKRRESKKISGGRLNHRSRQATHVDTYMKNQGEGTRLSVGGGERRSLDQHVFVKRRKSFSCSKKGAKF